MPRSDAEWSKWFERREAEKKNKRGAKPAEKRRGRQLRLTLVFP